MHIFETLNAVFEAHDPSYTPSIIGCPHTFSAGTSKELDSLENWGELYDGSWVKVDAARFVVDFDIRTHIKHNTGVYVGELYECIENKDTCNFSDEVGGDAEFSNYSRIGTIAIGFSEKALFEKVILALMMKSHPLNVV